MMNNTAIQWTEKTWNPFRGCSLVSKGCMECYAMHQAHRHSGKGEPYEGLTKMTPKGPVWNGEVRLVEHMIEKPLSWKKPSKIFVNSMSDIFHEGFSLDDIHRVFDVMHRADWHQFQILTKRSERLVELDSDLYWSDNIWMGVSIEDNPTRSRIRELTLTGAKVKFLSIEPLLEDLPYLALDGIDWVIVGGESGPKARPMQESWVSSIIEDCKQQITPVFVKQMGSVWAKQHQAKHSKGGDMKEWPFHLHCREYPEYDEQSDKMDAQTFLF